MFKKNKSAIIIVSALILLIGVGSGVYINSRKAENASAPSVEMESVSESVSESASASASVSTTTPNQNLLVEQTDVAYATKSETQKFDIYLPNKEGNLPIVLNIHGGAFMLGDKASSGGGSGFGGDGTNNAKDKMMTAGYAYASMNYRLSGEAIFPAAINDVKACVRYLKANAYELGINPDMIFVYGGSAGGNLAALAGTSGEVDFIETDEKLGNEDQESTVAGVVDLFGPVNFLTMDSDFAELGVSGNTTNQESSPESKYIGQLITDAPELVAASNPETYITANDPKMFIQHGTADTNIPYIQGKKLAEKFNAVVPGGAVFETIEGAGHGGSEFESDENLAKIIAFLNTIKNK